MLARDFPLFYSFVTATPYPLLRGKLCSPKPKRVILLFKWGWVCRASIPYKCGAQMVMYQELIHKPHVLVLAAAKMEYCGKWMYVFRKAEIGTKDSFNSFLFTTEYSATLVLIRAQLMVGIKAQSIKCQLGLRIQNRLWLHELQKLRFAQGFLFPNEPRDTKFI